VVVKGVRRDVRRPTGDLSMPNTVHLPQHAALAVPEHLAACVIALTAAEYEAATILAFDPEAAISPAALQSAQSCEDDTLYGLAASHFDDATWRRLTRACVSDADRYDDAQCLAAFLAERSAPSIDSAAMIQTS
jgi:hypothetical protein